MTRPIPDQFAFDEPQLMKKKAKFDVTPPSSPGTPKNQYHCPKAPTKTPHRSPLKNLNGNIHFLTQRKKTKSCSNHFDYLVKLGEGCFGEVWKVRSILDDKLYAIKKSKSPIWETSQRNQQLKEIEKGVKLGHHPNIVGISSAWEEGGHLYIQMELCERGNLKDTLAQVCQEEPEGGRIPEYLIWRYIVDIAQGLKHMHSFGILHLDVKPENLLFGEGGALKLCDFGISLEKDTEGDQVYMAPELLDDIQTPEADIFSFGITIFEIATNYSLPTQGYWWRKLREGEIPFPENTDISKDLKDLITQMMHPDRTKRISLDQLLDLQKVKDTISLIHSSRPPSLIRQSSIICNFTPLNSFYSNSNSSSNNNNNNNHSININHLSNSSNNFENEIINFRKRFVNTTNVKKAISQTSQDKENQLPTGQTPSQSDSSQPSTQPSTQSILTPTKTPLSSQNENILNQSVSSVSSTKSVLDSDHLSLNSSAIKIRKLF